MVNIFLLLIAFINICNALPVINVSKLIEKNEQEIKRCAYFAKYTVCNDNAILFLSKDSELVFSCNLYSLYLFSNIEIDVILNDMYADYIDCNDKVFVSGSLQFLCKSDDDAFVSFLNHIKVRKGKQLSIKCGDFTTIINGR